MFVKFPITLKAVVNTTKFLVNTEYYKQEIKNFYFEKGVLKEIKDHIEINANLTRRLKGYWEIGEKQGYVGIFWILNNKIYSETTAQLNKHHPYPINLIFKKYSFSHL